MRVATRDCLLLLAFLCCGTVQAQSCASLEVTEWLLGEWQGTRGANQIVERWRKVSTETFEGRGETSRDSKVIESETLRLVVMEQRVFYIAKVAQNELPIAFTLTQCAAQRLVFENPAHDFPKKLEYQLTGPNTFAVRVSAGERAFTLNFKRQKT